MYGTLLSLQLSVWTSPLNNVGSSDQYHQFLVGNQEETTVNSCTILPIEMILI